MPPATNKVVVRELEVRGNLRKFFNGMKNPEIVLDGPAGTGKTRVLLERQHLINFKYPGARGFMGRKYRSSMNETCMHVMKHEVLQQDADGSCAEGVKWRERDQKWIYPNGSEIIVGGMDDAQKLMSSMYDWIYFNEAIEIKLAEWETAKSRLRNFKVPYQQMLGDTNPGPPSHWIKKRSEDGKLALLPTFHKDNPVYWDAVKKEWTEKGRQYVEENLNQGLTGLRHKRLYSGLWVAAEGQVYDMWDPSIHVVERFKPPVTWPRYWVFDFGFIDPFVWQEWVEDPDSGDLYLYRELYHTHLLVEDAAAIIKQVRDGLPPMALICDHDAEDRATLEKHLGMLTLPAFKSISPGINAVQIRLNPSKLHNKPRMYIMGDANIKHDPFLVERHKPTCTEEEFESYVWDTGKITQDKYKDAPVDKDNHGMDCVRYATAFVDDVSIDPQQFETIINYNENVSDDEMVEHALNTMISLF